jgi:putative ABC transport system permease protein
MWFERFHNLGLRIRSVFRRRRLARELREELQFHLALREEKLIRHGLPPREAYYAARREFGNPTLLAEENRDMWTFRSLEAFLQDLRRGLRALAENPGFTLVAVLTLALGIGANTAVFSVLNAVMLRPLPFVEPDRLVAVQALDNRGGPHPAPLSYPDFFDLRARNRVFEHFLTYRDDEFTLTGLGQPTQIPGEMVTWDLFPALGVQPVLGRGFEPRDEDRGARVAILSYGFWQRQFGGNKDVAGRTITLDRQAFTVVGVAPAGFKFPLDNPRVQLWTTIALDKGTGQPGESQITEERGAHLLPGLARLQPGVTLAQARADLDTIAAALAKQYPDSNQNRPQVTLMPESQRLIGDARQPLLLLLGAVALVLLIACANIANLLLARTAAREHEMAVRSALGASRARVILQLLTESLVLALLGCAAGTLLAEGALRVILPLGEASIPRLAQASIDGHVLAFSILLAVFTSLIFGMAPAWRASRVNLTGTLQEGSRSILRGNDRLRGVLVVSQMALGLVLATGAGLLLASFRNLESSDLGFNPRHLLTFRYSLPETQYRTPQQVVFTDSIMERLRALPGVQSVTGIWPLPLGGDDVEVSFDVKERSVPEPSRPAAHLAFVTPGYFASVGTPLLEGREFTDRDDLKAPPVVIVNRAFAQKFFPDEDVIGKKIESGAGTGNGKTEVQEIVGVVGNSKLSAFDREMEPVYYFPYQQLPWQPPNMVMRTALPPGVIGGEIREQVKALDSQVPISGLHTMDDLLAVQITSPRFHVWLFGSFAVLALLLTLVGFYGVMAYSVARRSREIGIRMALGAGQGTILSLVLKRALIFVLLGLSLGLVGAYAATHLLSGMLYGVKPLNPAVYALACLLLALTGFLAAYLPARRAAKVDPLVALRYE